MNFLLPKEKRYINESRYAQWHSKGSSAAMPSVVSSILPNMFREVQLVADNIQLHSHVLGSIWQGFSFGSRAVFC
jgi:hypothetical protein